MIKGKQITAQGCVLGASDTDLLALRLLSYSGEPVLGVATRDLSVRIQQSL